ncbi:hypothetical protein [Roseisalinus antarcticus]|uniref:hypothetical protein n=1 Tax=Roseisalinus antarcticus TaxID=254357 RepID=UPI000A26E8D5|nr:hypothetical protein [Roseisalinus antarcticus]
MLMAFLNIIRIYDNWFEPRQYRGSGAAVAEGMSAIRIPGTKETFVMPQMATTAPFMRAPEMRPGQIRKRRKSGQGRRLTQRASHIAPGCITAHRRREISKTSW